MLDVHEEIAKYGGAAVPSRRPRLLDRVSEELRTRHYSRRTEEAYRHWVVRFHRLRHPREIVDEGA